MHIDIRASLVTPHVPYGSAASSVSGSSDLVVAFWGRESLSSPTPIQFLLDKGNILIYIFDWETVGEAPMV
jgi:hypothetical protein